MRIDPDFVRRQIANLEISYPSLQEDSETWALAIESETDALECLAQLVEKIDDAKALAGGVAGRIAELENRLARFEQREKALRSLAHKIMDAASLKKAELALATLSVRAGTERVVVNDEASVPDIFCKITRTPDKTKIKELLAGGAVINWAAIERGEPSLSIRVK